MKSKKQIKLHKSVIEVINSATELVNSMIELHKLKSKPIPDYSKCKKSNGLMIVSQRNEKETIVTPDGKRVEIKPTFNFKETENHLSDSFKYFLDFGGRNSGRTSLYEEWSRKLNERLKQKGLNNSQPFGFPDFIDMEQFLDAPKRFKEMNKHLYLEKVDFQKGMLEADNELQKAFKGSKCSHRNTTTSTYYDIPSGKIIFTVKRCNNCNIDLLK